MRHGGSKGDTPRERMPNALATCPGSEHDCHPTTAEDRHAPLAAAACHHRAVVPGLADPRTRSTVCRPGCRLRLAPRVAGGAPGPRADPAAGGIPRPPARRRLSLCRRIGEVLGEP